MFIMSIFEKRILIVRVEIEVISDTATPHIFKALRMASSLPSKQISLQRGRFCGLMIPYIPFTKPRFSFREPFGVSLYLPEVVLVTAALIRMIFLDLLTYICTS